MVFSILTCNCILVFVSAFMVLLAYYLISELDLHLRRHWAPQIAELILQTIPSFNLKGIIMGNPFMEFTTDYNSSAEFLWSHELIFVDTYGLLRTVCNYAQIMRENINETLSSICDRVLYQFTMEVGRFDHSFNIIDDVCLPLEFQLVYETPDEVGEKRDVCVESATSTYMNRREVHEEIHAKLVGITKWTTCSDVLLYNGKNLEDPTISLLGRLVKSGVRVMVYSGDQDSLIPLIGTESLLKGLVKDIGLDISEHHMTWFDGPQVAGWTQTYRDILTFTTIRGAGHATPTS